MDQWATRIINSPGSPQTEASDLEAQQDTFFPSRATTVIDGALSGPPSVCHVPTQKPAGTRINRSVEIQQLEWPAWHGYVALLAGLCQQILCWGMIMAFGTVLSYYAKHLMPGLSKKQLAVTGSIPPFCLLSLALFWGRLLDAGHHRHLNLIAGICITGGFLGMSFTGGKGGEGDGKYWAILLAAIPTGIGQSIYFLAAPHMAKTWFPKRKGLAMGVTNSGAAVGGATFPVAFTKMTERYSFRTAMSLLVGVSGILACLIWWASVPSPSFQRRELSKKSSFYTWWPRRAFRSWTFRVHVAAMCFLYLGILTIPFYIELWASKHKLGISEDSVYGTGINHKEGWLTVYLVVILNCCQLPGRWLGSTACDYIKARKIHCAAAIAISILIYPAWLKSMYFVSAAVFAGLFGFLLGIMVSLPVNDAQEILGDDRSHLFGQYSGAIYTCASPFIFGGAIIGGALVDAKAAGYYEAGVWAASVFLTGGFLILLSLLISDDTWKFDGPEPEPEPDTQNIPDEAPPESAAPQVSQVMDFVTRHPSVRVTN